MGKKTSSFVGVFLVTAVLFTVGSSLTLWGKFIKPNCKLKVIDGEHTIFKYNKTTNPIFQPLIAYRSAQSSVHIKIGDTKLNLENPENIPWWRLMQATFDLSSSPMKVRFRLGEDAPIDLNFTDGEQPGALMDLTAKDVWVTDGNCVSANGDQPYEIVKAESKSEFAHLLPITGETDFLIFTEKKHEKSHLRITSYYGDLAVCLSSPCKSLAVSELAQREECGPLMPYYAHWLTFVYDRERRKYGINSYMYELGRYFSFDNSHGTGTEEYHVVRCLTQCTRNGTDYPKYDIIEEECWLLLIIVAVLFLVAVLVDGLFVKRQWNVYVWLKSLARRKEREEEMKMEEEKKLVEQGQLPPLPSSPPPQLPENPPLSSSPAGPSSAADAPPPPPPPLLPQDN